MINLISFLISDSCRNVLDIRGIEFMSFCGYLGALYYFWGDTGVKEDTIPLKDTMHPWVTIH